MNPFFAAGLFDNPWVVLAFLAVGAIINWLSQRRQQKQQQQLEREEPSAEGSAPPGKPAENFDVEEALRRLLGEEPKPSPAPPPVPQIAPPPPVKTWRTETVVPVPPALPPPIVPGLPTIKGSLAARQLELTAQSLEQRPLVAPVAVAMTGRRPTRRSAAHLPHGWDWRNPQSTRKAFVASLIFSPPKGLEP